MPGHRSNSRGTLRVDLTFPGVGRIARATGTRDERTLTLYVGMLRTLYAAGRLDLLTAIHEGQVTIAEVWDAYRPQQGRGADLSRLPSPDTLRRLWLTDSKGYEVGAFQQWLDGRDRATETLRNNRRDVRTLRKAAGTRTSAMTAGDLPLLLERVRRKCLAAQPQQRRTYNSVRDTVGRFLKDTVGRRHPLYFAVRDTEALTEKRGQTHPMSPAEARQLCADIVHRHGHAHARVLWAMCCTGMRPKEFWQEEGASWTVRPDRVVVHGTKTDNAVRVIPLIDAAALAAVSPMPVTKDRADKRLRALVQGADVFTARGPYPVPHTLYDCRRTFAHWMEEAEIPRSRRRAYMGHRKADVTDLYEAREVTEFLMADAAKLRQYLGLDATAGIRLVKDGDA